MMPTNKQTDNYLWVNETCIIHNIGCALEILILPVPNTLAQASLNKFRKLFREIVMCGGNLQQTTCKNRIFIFWVCCLGGSKSLV